MEKSASSWTIVEWQKPDCFGWRVNADIESWLGTGGQCRVVRGDEKQSVFVALFKKNKGVLTRGNKEHWPRDKIKNKSGMIGFKN